ncbi:50S ribosomal protein L29 [bacterium]|nr:50S ribosomal protein L29 [bacterium]MBU1599806.1 50S ribosomal protein L29 [bacterium]
MKAKELRTLPKEELLEKKKEFSSQILNLRHQRAIKGLEKPHKIKEIRRSVATINTLLREDILGIRRKG